MSDGDCSPEQLAIAMAEAGVRYASLTDHDTCRGQERFRAALKSRGISFVSGAELQVQSAVGVLHLLAYGFDPRDPVFLRVLRALRSPVLAAAHDWKESLHAYVSRRRGRPYSAPAKDLPARLPPHRLIGVAEALIVIHNAGGRAFLAHPFTGTPGPDRLDGILTELRCLGLDGIEAFYKPYGEEARQVLVEVAERHDLLVSAGSDYHGPHMPGAVSPGLDVPERYWSRFIEAVTRI